MLIFRKGSVALGKDHSVPSLPAQGIQRGIEKRSRIPVRAEATSLLDKA